MGRGRSKAGGGGMLNKDSGATVKSSHPLVDAIQTGGGTFANEIQNTRDAFEREWGDAAKGLNLSLATFNQKGVLGAYGDNTLYLNEKFVQNKNLTAAMQAAAANGFHPSIGSKTGAEAVAAHEMSHMLAEKAASKANISQQEIVARAAKRLNAKPENMAGKISEYARYNWHETIAEAGADVFCNGKNASRASKAIMKELKSILK